VKKFKYGNVILRTNDPKKEKELLLRGFVEVKEAQKGEKKSEKKTEKIGGKKASSE